MHHVFKAHPVPWHRTHPLPYPWNWPTLQGSRRSKVWYLTGRTGPAGPGYYWVRPEYWGLITPHYHPGTLVSWRNHELLKQNYSLENIYMNLKPTTYFFQVPMVSPIIDDSFLTSFLSHFDALPTHPQILRLSLKRMSFSKAGCAPWLLWFWSGIECPGVTYSHVKSL